MELLLICVLLFIVGGLILLYFGNSIQKWLEPVRRLPYKLEIVALIGFLVIGLFPPWQCRYEAMAINIPQAEGFHFIASSHRVIFSEREIVVPMRVDVGLLSVEWILWLGFCGGLVLIRRAKRKET